MAEKVVGIPKPVAELAHAQLLAFEVLRRIILARYSTPVQLRWMVSTIESSVIFRRPYATGSVSC